MIGATGPVVRRSLRRALPSGVPSHDWAKPIQQVPCPAPRAASMRLLAKANALRLQNAGAYLHEFLRVIPQMLGVLRYHFKPPTSPVLVCSDRIWD